MKSDRKHWEERFRGREFAFGRKANSFLRKHIGLLPKGRALDIAAGEGRNSVFLARHGLMVDAVDIAEQGLRKARRLAREMGVKVNTIGADLDTYRVNKGHYDLIVNFYFLKRSLIPRIKKGLKKGGRIVFETYILEQRQLGTGGPQHSRYFLKHNELLNLFKDFRILLYREGIFREGGKKRAIASLMAEKC